MRRLEIILSSLFVVALSGCAPAEPREPDPAGEAAAADTARIPPDADVIDVTRDHVSGDIHHYTFTLRVGSTPNARVRLHRVTREEAPFRPRRAASSVMLLHGDFATFSTNFAPDAAGAERPPHGGLAVYLAERGVDVWGMDRRWTLTPADATDVSDFGAMNYAEELDDLALGLAFARDVRAFTGSGRGKMILGGFSRGAHLAYVYAGRESQLPPGKRHVRGLVPIDIYVRIAPEDEAYRQNACVSLQYDEIALQQGVVDSDNGFQITAGELAASAPDAPSPFPFFPGLTNREVVLTFLGQTYFFFQPTPVYHLAGTTLADGAPAALRFMTEPVANRWLASAPFHQALAEAADTDAMWCGEGPPPVADHLEDIRVPLYYLGAAGGFGDHGLYTTSLVGSADVTTNVVRRLGADHEDEDFGHGDLLYAADAVAPAWEPLAAWLLAH